jgi:hypothetical protein
MQQTRSSHIVIAGTGRTGTTFLVRYLTELGLDTHIARQGLNQLDANANAGLEDIPLLAPAETLPYVIKAPWIGDYIDEILAAPNLQIEVVILPMRDLVEAASSRTILELRALHQSAPGMAQVLNKTWENWATTPGGTIFSLNPLDQARILAVGFHRLIQRLVDAQIPTLFLGFPRLVEDGKYLFEQLRSILPDTVTLQQALAAYQRTAQRDKVRVGHELGFNNSQDKTFTVVPGAINYPDHDLVDRVALGREIARLNQERAKQEAERATLNAKLEAERADFSSEIARLNQDRAKLEAECAALNANLEAEHTNFSNEIARLNQHRAKLAAELDAVQRSKLWRVMVRLDRLGRAASAYL